MEELWRFSLAILMTILACQVKVEAAPDVNELSLPSQNFEPGSQSQGQGSCAKLAARENECVEKIAKMEYRPLITIVEQKYTVPVPNIIYTDVIDPQEQPFDVKVPKIVRTKVNVTHIKEQPQTLTLTKIKEVLESVPVVTTDVVRIPTKIPNPQVTDETIVIPDIKQGQQTKIVKKYKPKSKTITIETFREEPTIRTVRRPIVTRTSKLVNRTRIEFVKKVVERPNIIYKKLRLPRPVIKKGETIFVQMGSVTKKPATYTEESPEYVDQTVMMDIVKSEPKTVMMPYLEKTKVVRPIVLEAPINMPEKEMVTIERNTRVAGPEVMVPCGVPTQGTPYLPANCPACASSQNCPKCSPCQMKGYKYPKPEGGSALI